MIYSANMEERRISHHLKPLFKHSPLRKSATSLPISGDVEDSVTSTKAMLTVLWDDYSEPIHFRHHFRVTKVQLLWLNEEVI